MHDRDMFIIYDYQQIAGPVGEFDPASILREISTDVNTIINGIVDFCTVGSFFGDKPLSVQLPNTLSYIQRELAAHNVVLDMQNVVAYVSGAQKIALAYATALSSNWHWLGYYPEWIGARHSLNAIGGVEFVVSFNTLKFEAFSSPQASFEATPKAMVVLEMLIGNLGGSL